MSSHSIGWDGGLLLDALPGPAAGARLDLERALLLGQVARLLAGGVAVEAVGVGQRQVLCAGLAAVPLPCPVVVVSV